MQHRAWWIPWAHKSSKKKIKRNIVMFFSQTAHAHLWRINFFLEKSIFRSHKLEKLFGQTHKTNGLGQWMGVQIDFLIQLCQVSFLFSSVFGWKLLSFFKLSFTVSFFVYSSGFHISRMGFLSIVISINVSMKCKYTD